MLRRNVCTVAHGSSAMHIAGFAEHFSSLPNTFSAERFLLHRVFFFFADHFCLLCRVFLLCCVLFLYVTCVFLLCRVAKMLGREENCPTEKKNAPQRRKLKNALQRSKVLHREENPLCRAEKKTLDREEKRSAEQKSDRQRRKNGSAEQQCAEQRNIVLVSHRNVP